MVCLKPMVDKGFMVSHLGLQWDLSQKYHWNFQKHSAMAPTGPGLSLKKARHAVVSLWSKGHRSASPRQRRRRAGDGPPPQPRPPRCPGAAPRSGRPSRRPGHTAPGSPSAPHRLELFLDEKLVSGRFFPRFGASFLDVIFAFWGLALNQNGAV